MNKTFLYDQHVSLGAKIVEFGGWMMPLQYKGIIQEHLTVRNSVGIFDVSHMGRVAIEGPDSEAFLDFLCTNKIAEKKNGSAIYTVMCNENGGAIDDLLVYRVDETHFFVILNAGNRQKDLEHIQKYAQSFDVKVLSKYSEEGILAIQGPEAFKIFPEAEKLNSMSFYFREDVIISRTGYTGAGGIEIYAPNSILLELWDSFISQGVEPIGLGARDTLRLEKGYSLYGHELSENICPIETVASWTVKLNRENFLGKEAMLSLKDKRFQYGVILMGRGVARDGYKVFKEGKNIGVVTSGTYSPTLEKSIAIVMVDGFLSVDDDVEIEIRDRLVSAKIVKLPFV